MQLIPKKVDGKDSKAYFEAAGFKYRYKVTNHGAKMAEKMIAVMLQQNPELTEEEKDEVYLKFSGAGWDAVEFDPVSGEENHKNYHEAPTWTALQMELESYSL